MMHAALTLVLSLSQASQLVAYCRAYRTYAWHTLPPSAERNQTMKAAQAVQGRLAAFPTGGAEPLHLSVSEEEKQALRHLLLTLLQMHGTEQPSAERDQQCREMGAMLLLVGAAVSPDLSLRKRAGR